MAPGAPHAIIPDAHHPRVWGRQKVTPKETDRQHPHRSRRRWGPGAQTLTEAGMGKPRSHRPSHTTHRRPPMSHGPRVTCCGWKHGPHTTHLPRVPHSDHTRGDQGINYTLANAPNPALTCPRDSAPRLQLQVPRGQDFTLRRESGVEGGAGTLAEGGSLTQLTFTKAPLCTRLPWRLSAEELACDAGGLQDIQVPWLDREDPQEEEMASHISILA